MSEASRIRHQLKLSYYGAAWHGPALKEVLEGVSAATAASRPIEDAHSIWQIVRHIAAWDTEVARVLDGKAYDTLAGEADWPPVTDTSHEAWTAALGELENAQKALIDAAANLTDEQLEQTVPGRDFKYYYLLHGLVHHTVYHAGQISILKKAGATEIL